jgi:hypothetical protein
MFRDLVHDSKLFIRASANRNLVVNPRSIDRWTSRGRSPEAPNLD